MDNSQNCYYRTSADPRDCGTADSGACQSCRDYYAGTLTIGDGNRADTVRIADTRWDSNGTLFVTVREMIGGYDSWRGGRVAALRVMRDTARRALSNPVSARVTREWTSGGQNYATFAVLRHPRD